MRSKVDRWGNEHTVVWLPSEVVPVKLHIVVQTEEVPGQATVFVEAPPGASSKAVTEAARHAAYVEANWPDVEVALPIVVETES